MNKKVIVCALMILLPGLSSTVNGQWLPIGPADKQVISIETHPSQPGYIYTGTNFSGMYMTTDGGQVWHNKIGSNLPVSFVGVDPHSPDMFALVSDSWSAGIYRSTDSGEFWQLINYLPNPRRMAFDSYYPGWVYITFPGGIITSIEYGYDYQVSIYGLPDTNIVDIMAHGSNMREAYVLGEAFAARTTNFGQEWGDLGGLFGLEDYNPCRIVHDPDRLDTLYVTTWAYLARSYDRGNTWDYFETPTVYNMPIVCHPTAPGTLYIGSIGGGVLKYNDFWEVFEDITGDLGNLNVYCLAIDIEGRLLAGTDNGVYVNDFVTGIGDKKPPLPDSPVLNQNYPNPFNASTRISFTMPQSGHVKIAVYDLMGREISVLIDGMMVAGENGVDFDTSDLSSGVYFYRMVAGEFSDTKRLTLIK